MCTASAFIFVDMTKSNIISLAHWEKSPRALRRIILNFSFPKASKSKICNFNQNEALVGHEHENSAAQIAD